MTGLQPDATVGARRSLVVVATASAIMLIVTGVRQTTGLFVAPIHEATGMSLVSISLALAIGQFMWGAAQSVFGVLADRYGSALVLLTGALLLAAGNVITTFSTTPWMLIVSFGVLAAAGAGAGSFSVLIGATARQLAPERRAFGAGIINAGGSVGQMIFAPLVQAVISASGWVVAMYALAAASIATIPFIRPLAGKGGEPARAAPDPVSSAQANAAARSRYTQNSNHFMRRTLPSQPEARLPPTLARPMIASDVAATLGGKPQSPTSPGRCVTRNAMWKPQVKKPIVSSQ